MANEYYITAGLPPIDNSLSESSNTYYISAGLVSDDLPMSPNSLNFYNGFIISDFDIDQDVLFEDGYTITSGKIVGYHTYFEEYTVGNFPSGWTKQWNTTNQNYTVIEDSSSPSGGNVLKLDNINTDDRCAISWDQVGNQSDVEILALIKADNTYYYQSYLIIRGSGAEGTEEGIRCLFYRDEIILTSYGGSFSENTVLPVSDNTWYWVRFRVEGTNVRVKAWDRNFYNEPDAWMVTVTESNLTDGWVGIGGYGSSYDGYVDYFSVGINGASAPEPSTDVLKVGQFRTLVMAEPLNLPNVQLGSFRTMVMYSESDNNIISPSIFIIT